MIPHNRPSSFAKEQEYIQQVLSSRQLVNGQFTEAFENAICEYMDLNSGHALAVTSGTSALYIALMLLGAKSKKIAMPSYACSSLKHSTLLANAHCNILDIEQALPVVSQSELDKSLSDILINPYLFGHASKLPEFDGPIIEDCAQAIGASYKGQKLGTRGKIGIFSFYATKLLTSGGQGGMLVSEDRGLIDEARDFIHFDMKKDSRLRFNFCMTEIQAASGLAQFEHFDDMLTTREEILQLYKSAGLPLLEPTDSMCKNVPFRAVLETQNPKALINHLEKMGIKAIIPIETWELLDPNLGNAKSLSLRTVSLPIYPELRDAEYITSVVKNFL